ncbi:LAGLIDADG family homing endonuclease [Streptomyces sp. NPDC102360]|uniref:LAGLIDADG family homing endonuclease n=1 Tax=Streptomyces sp. NPDC102360 TaxID=3366160 RepID=UPI0038243152
MDLDMPDYAYMFGFLQADGHLGQGPGQKGRLTLEVSVRDIDLLYRFKQLTPYDSSVTERIRSTNFAESYHSATWRLCSSEARATLNGLGMPYGPKSKKIAPPNGVFSHRDYLRGLVDADGSVGEAEGGVPFISLTTSSTAISLYLCSYAGRLTGVTREPKRNTRDQVYNVTYYKEAAQSLCANLYYPGCLSLGRKQVKAETAASWVRPASMRKWPARRSWTPQEDEILLRTSDPAATAQELDRTEKSCYIRLWRLRNGRLLPPSNQ